MTLEDKIVEMLTPNLIENIDALLDTIKDDRKDEALAILIALFTLIGGPNI